MVDNRCCSILRREIAVNYPIDGMVAFCEPMLDVLERIRRVAPTDTTALIIGETGTGKELVARAIHSQSERRGKALVSINCAAFAESQIESELFGHERGAFTGALEMKKGLIEAANGGTLFLDEIGELPLDAQARLLGVLQDNQIRRVGSSKVIKVRARVLAATGRSEEAVFAALRALNDFPGFTPAATLLAELKRGVPVSVGYVLNDQTELFGELSTISPVDLSL